jgi:tRNA dimethylallyltransferase
MHAALAAIDPRAATRIQAQDAQRIQRALEVYRLTGKTLSELHGATVPPVDNVRFFAYAWVPSERERLYEAIAARFHAMMDAGLLDEVRTLYARADLHDDLPAIRSVGYRQLWEHLQGKEALDASVQRAIFATRHLARRQLIWLRSEAEVCWVDPLESAAEAHMLEAIAQLENRAA